MLSTKETGVFRYFVSITTKPILIERDEHLQHQGSILICPVF